MFKPGSVVLYGTEGVCTIKEIVQKEFGGESRQYYVLEALQQRKSTIFVPTDNEALTSRMRSVISREEIDKVIEESSRQSFDWVDDDTERRESFKEIISRSDCRELVHLIRVLYLRQETVAEQGKKLSVADARVLKTAEKMIFDEFAIALQIEPEEVLPFILAKVDRLQKEEKPKARSSFFR